MLQCPSEMSNWEKMQIVDGVAVCSVETRPLASVNRCLVAVEGCGCQQVQVQERWPSRRCQGLDCTRLGCICTPEAA